MLHEEVRNKNDFFQSGSRKIVAEKMSLINFTINNDTYCFLIQLFIDNPNYQTEDIIVPKINEYVITTKRLATIDVREFWESEVSSYLKDENDLKEMQEVYDIIDWWDGEKVDSDEYNEDTIETEIYEINKL